MRTDDVLGGLYVETDLCAGDPSDICRSMAVGAQKQGMYVPGPVQYVSLLPMNML